MSIREAIPNHTILVYTIPVKNITLSADENLIAQARQAAADQHTTLNAAFRLWLQQFAGREERARKFDEIMERTKYFRVDPQYTREEMNERYGGSRYERLRIRLRGPRCPKTLSSTRSHPPIAR